MTDTHPLFTVETVVLVAIGGFAGSNLRHFVGQFLPGIGGTLVVNVFGCVVLGFLLYEALFSGLFTERTRLIVGTGFLSSLTTYSTFALETATTTGWLIVGNVVATYTLGFLGILLGRWLAARLDSGRSVGGGAD
ncbi:MAG: CrcB family protein [Halobacteriales archaeon]|nr:CrcB family protein [Halobacteriales archaeon]